MSFRLAITAFAVLALCYFSSGKQLTNRQEPRPALKVAVDLVVVPVTVLDRDGRYVNGLPRDSFRLLENKVEQTITQFSIEDAPMSLGIILDTSRSMSDQLPAASRNAGDCFTLGTQADEYFLMLFSDEVYTLTDFTTEFNRLQGRLRYVKSSGNTALNDALLAGVTTLKRGSNPRKALVVVSDGYDNHSRTPGIKVREAVKESDLQIYSIGNTGSGLLNELSDLSGGRSLSGYSGTALQGICNEVVKDLKGQYMLGYKSSNQASDGKWREIRIKLKPPTGLGRLTARAKAGYYAAGPAAK